MAIVETTTHTDEARALLLQQFRGTVNYQKLLDSFSAEVQKLEVVLFDLYTGRALNNAIGAQLDGLGEIVKEPRNGRDDTAYRLALRARIRINVGSGTIEDINAIMSLMFQTTVWLEQQYPAGFVVRVGPLPIADATTGAKILKTSRAGGVYAALEYFVQPTANVFTLGDTTMPADAAQGFGDTGGTTGGYFATAIGA